MTTSALTELSRSYESQCDGDWEHSGGVHINTLDNPGWRVMINLDRTNLESTPFEEISDLGKNEDWIRCWKCGTTFHGAGDPTKLETILETFLDWAVKSRIE